MSMANGLALPKVAYRKPPFEMLSYAALRQKTPQGRVGSISKAIADVEELLKRNYARDAHGRFARTMGSLASIPKGPFRRVRSAAEAIAALARGEYVELPPNRVGTLMNKLADSSREAEKRGEKAKPIDLCKVSVRGTNIFCHGNKGVSRADMPQIEDRAGFESFLKKAGATTANDMVDASRMKATQGEIDGVKVAGMMKAARAGKFDPRGQRIFVSSDNFVLDGHHRWASAVGLEYTSHKRMPMQVTRVNLPITALLPLANAFVDTGGGSRAGFGKGLFAEIEEILAKYNENHDQRGRFASGGSSSSASPDDSGGGEVTLYRGDSTSIDHFDVSKTDPQALFGQGLYLTDNKRIAGDYRSKGTGGDVVFRGTGSKEWAVDQHIRRDLAGNYDEQGHPIESMIARMLNSVRPAQEGSVRHKAALAEWETTKRDYNVRKLASGEVVIERKMGASRVSRFKISKALLERTIDAEAEISTDVADGLSRALERSGDKATARDLHRFATTANEDGFRPTYRDVYTRISSGSPLITAKGQAIMRSSLASLGYRGIRYEGGVTMGGAKHTAYVLWAPHNRMRKAIVDAYAVLNFNPNHDARGKFASGSGVASTVPDFKDIDQATAWMHENYPAMKVDFSNANIETIRATVKQYHKLAQKYPEVAGGIGYLGTGGLLQRPDGSVAQVDAWEWASRPNSEEGDGNVWASAPQAQGRIPAQIHLSQRVFNDPERFDEELSHSVEAPDSDGLTWHPPGGDSVESVITHEFGHQVFDYLQRQTMTEWAPGARASGFGLVADTTRAWATRRHAEAGHSVGRTIYSGSGTATKITPKWAKEHQLNSRYAYKSEHEMFAEGFVEVHHNYGKLSPYGRRMKTFLDTVADASKWRRASSANDVRWLQDIKDEGERKTAFENLESAASRLEVSS